MVAVKGRGREERQRGEGKEGGRGEGREERRRGRERGKERGEDIIHKLSPPRDCCWLYLEFLQLCIKVFYFAISLFK